MWLQNGARSISGPDQGNGGPDQHLWYDFGGRSSVRPQLVRSWSGPGPDQVRTRGPAALRLISATLVRTSRVLVRTKATYNSFLKCVFISFRVKKSKLVWREKPRETERNIVRRLEIVILIDYSGLIRPFPRGLATQPV